jgi:hypothetical protein
MSKQLGVAGITDGAVYGLDENERGPRYGVDCSSNLYYCVALSVATGQC